MSKPSRSCVACRQRSDRHGLVRLAVHPELGVVVDYTAKMPGRGVWLHPRRECVARVSKSPGMLRRGLGPALLSVDLLVMMREIILRSALDGLSMASASGALVGGHERLTAALRQGTVTEIVLAVDIADRTLRSLREAAGETMAFTQLPLDRDALGNKVGRGPRAALGLTSSRSANHLRRQLRRLRDLG